VLILTISEFDRTVYENVGRGTDHGFSSVAFAIGGMVNCGAYGLYPGLSDGNLVFDGLTDVMTDFRSSTRLPPRNSWGWIPRPSWEGAFRSWGSCKRVPSPSRQQIRTSCPGHGRQPERLYLARKKNPLSHLFCLDCKERSFYPRQVYGSPKGFFSACPSKGAWAILRRD
jgi:hypothetical protein